MHCIRERAHAERSAPIEVVMLPAAYTGPEDFVSAGFVEALRARRLNIDVTFASLEFGHITDRSVVARVREELLAPARARGCAVWLGGISLGGYVALCCADREPSALAGLCLLAPYLGSHIVTSEIARSGLAAWRGAAAAEDDDERRVWRFLQARRPQAPPIHLGLGREDRFGQRHRLLAAALDPRDVDTVPGGHDWPTWRRLWENFLDARLAARD
jgi:enterochelin esterase-like enzyme